MAKNVDYSKIKALSQQILECIGDYSEGEDPSLPKPDRAYNDGGQKSLIAFLPNDKTDTQEGAVVSPKQSSGMGDDEEAEGEESPSKKKRDSAIAMMGSVLASKFNK